MTLASSALGRFESNQARRGDRDRHLRYKPIEAIVYLSGASICRSLPAHQLVLPAARDWRVANGHFFKQTFEVKYGQSLNWIVNTPTYVLLWCRWYSYKHFHMFPWLSLNPFYEEKWLQADKTYHNGNWNICTIIHMIQIVSEVYVHNSTMNFFPHMIVGIFPKIPRSKSVKEWSIIHDPIPVYNNLFHWRCLF